MKRLRISYLSISILALLPAVTLWPSISWSGKVDDRIAAVQARGELRASTIHIPLTYNEINGKSFGLDYELAKQFADYLGIKLKMIVWRSINQLFDDLDNGNADPLVVGLVYSSERVKNYQFDPTYYSMSQQLAYKAGQYRPHMLGDLTAEQLTVAPGHVMVNDLRIPKETKFPESSWKVDDKRGPAELMESAIEGKLDYTIADSVAISLFQRIHSELTVALDITDEQPVIWFSPSDSDNTPFAALFNFFNEMNEDDILVRIEEKYPRYGDDSDYVDTRISLRAVDAVLPQLKPLLGKYVERIDQHLLAAIACQESHWDAQTISPAGVRGIMIPTKSTTQGLGITGRTDVRQNINGGVCYLQDVIGKVPESVPENERIWFALAAYNMGYARMLDTRALTVKIKGNPDSWADVKQRLPLPSQKPYYNKLTYGHARGHEVYVYVENIRRYQIGLVGYLQEKEKQTTEAAMQLAQDYPTVSSMRLGKEESPFLSLPSRSSSNYLTHSSSLLFSRKGSEEKQN